VTARTLFALLTFAVLSGWVSGQGPAPRRTAAEEADLLNQNRQLLEGMLDDGILVADAGTPLERAAACRRAADRLAAELAQAARLDNADRVSEIGDHLTALLADGFLPPFAAARAEIRAGSPEFGRLQELHRESAMHLNAAVSALATRGELASSPRVKALREKLAGLAERVGQPEE
jgi:hypothetical protein